MFERFTKAARDAVVLAQAEAAALGEDHIGTEHLLLGVAGGPGEAARVLADHGATPEALRAAALPRPEGPLDAGALASIGIDLDEIRRRVEASFGPGALERGHRPRRRAGSVRMTPGAKKSLELALREALARGDRHIGAEHVLLGLLRDERAEAVAVLGRTGASPAAVREAFSAEASRRGRGG